jgi:hypothetical protein
MANNVRSDLVEGKTYRVLVILPNGKRKFQWKIVTGGHLL